MKIALQLFVLGAIVLLTSAMLLTAGFTRPPVHAIQTGYRGTGLDQLSYPDENTILEFAKTLPYSKEAAATDSEKATDVYKNVKVLTDLNADQFIRVMLAITEWVAPDQGCAYCHNVENLADDGLYTKTVARRMLQMTRYINTDWKQHVANTGVTCYTCHRGMPIPSYIWFNNPPASGPGGFAATNYGFGHPAKLSGTSELPADPLTPYLESKDNSEPIRVIAANALPGAYGAPIQKSELTYSLMISMSESLGVNCDYCHNTRAFAVWDQSRPQRVTAWYGIRMARSINETYLNPLKAVFPDARLGPHGDSPKVYCATCHQGVFKPLYGFGMAKYYPELGGVSQP